MPKDLNNSYKYREIYQYYKNQIVNRQLTAGQKLPTENEIGAIFGVSRITVVKAMNALVSEGYIYRVRGKGTFAAKISLTDNTAVPQTENVSFISLIMAFKPTGCESLILESIEREISQAGYLLSISNSYGQPEIEHQCIKNVKDIAKGIILYPSCSNNGLYFQLFQENYPLVFIDRYPPNLPCSYVTSDNRSGGFQIGQWFCDHGHRRFAMAFHNLMNFSSERDRYEGFVEALRQQNISGTELSLYSVDQENSQLELLVKELLSPSDPQNPITAVFVCNDLAAEKLISRLLENGYSFESGLVIAGFDALYAPPMGIPFITVKQDYSSIGQTAAQFLLNKINKKDLFYHETMEVPVGLVVNCEDDEQ
ncbi:MAG: GntR family transcriptional regulator [Eubacteriales bacterium]|nr:GntR family transcriptional regulator [Eubacteriales bacterium]